MAPTPSGVGPATGSPSTSAKPPAPSITTATVGTTAIMVYLAMWEDMVEAARTADYQSPRLGDHATSQAFLLLTGSLRKASDGNLVIQGEPTFEPKVTNVTPSANPVAVSIQDCVDDSRWLNYTRDGQLQNDTPGGKHRTTATVGLVNGRWMVTRLQIGEVGSCS